MLSHHMNWCLYTEQTMFWYWIKQVRTLGEIRLRASYSTDLRSVLLPCLNTNKPNWTSCNEGKGKNYRGNDSVMMSLTWTSLCLSQTCNISLKMFVPAHLSLNLKLWKHCVEKRALWWTGGPVCVVLPSDAVGIFIPTSKLS